MKSSEHPLASWVQRAPIQAGGRHSAWMPYRLDDISRDWRQRSPKLRYIMTPLLTNTSVRTEAQTAECKIRNA